MRIEAYGLPRLPILVNENHTGAASAAAKARNAQPTQASALSPHERLRLLIEERHAATVSSLQAAGESPPPALQFREELGQNIDLRV